MASVSRVLVIGGGIGGLTAGIALRQQGVAVDLVEIAPSLAVYGVGIIQPNNTLRALDRIGLAQPCVDIGAPFPGWEILDREGNALMKAPSPDAAAPQFPPVNGITRPQLHTILTDAAAAHEVNIMLGRSVSALDSDDAGVDVTFADGRSGRYDLVVASDGIASATRRMVFGDAFEPRFTGQGVWRYNLPRPAAMEWGQIWFGSASKVGLVPLSATLMYMFVVTAEPGNPWHEGPQLAQTMRERIAEYGGLLRELAPLISDSAQVVYKPMHNVLLPAPWHRGRVVVIGDAAHATTPHLAQGAAMAIEDAVLLAELLGGDGDVAAQLDEFSARRVPRGKFVVDASTQLAQWELEAWSGVHNPAANPGAFLHASTEKLMEAY